MIDYERRAKVAKVVSLTLFVVAAWLASTMGMAYLIAEWRAHGAEHAYVKTLMQRDKQHEDEHAALRELIRMVNQQIAQQQGRPAPTEPAPPPLHK